eukprot:10222265-Alexandrium_andersonii.AAC.1
MEAWYLRLNDVRCQNYEDALVVAVRRASLLSGIVVCVRLRHGASALSLRNSLCLRPKANH